MSHPDFAVLTVSWELALRADGVRRQHRQGLPERGAEPGRVAGRAPSRGRAGRAGPPAHPGLAGRGPRAPLAQYGPRVVRRGPALLPVAGERGEADQDATAGIRTRSTSSAACSVPPRCPLPPAAAASCSPGPAGWAGSNGSAWKAPARSPRGCCASCTPTARSCSRSTAPTGRYAGGAAIRPHRRRGGRPRGAVAGRPGAAEVS